MHTRGPDRACGRAAGLLLAAALAAGCAATPPPASGPGALELEAQLAQAERRLHAAESDARGAELEARAQRERAESLERTVADLREDLAEAGQTLIDIESGLRGAHTRADAVSSLAEARILVERASGAAPWRAEEIAACQERLDEADRHVHSGHFGTAIFFASRAQRASTRLLAEARRITDRDDLRYVKRERVNLRASPTTRARVLDRLLQGTPVLASGNEGAWIRVRTLDGRVGWMHGALLGRTAPPPASAAP